MTRALITPTELLQAATGFSWADISEQGTTAAIEAIEQQNVINRATDIINGFLDMDPTTTTDTEVARLGVGSTKAWVDTDGWLWFKTNYFPALSVSSLQWATASAGTGALSYTSLTAANVLIYGENFRLSRLVDFSQDWTWARYGPTLIKAVYVNGWPNMLLQATISAGSNVAVQVDTTTGLTATAGAIGNSLVIYDADKTETITVQSVTDSTHFVANTVANAHTPTTTNPLGISALPADIKQAAIWTCVAIAREPGTDAISMDESGGAKITGNVDTDAWAKAEYLLERYRRMP